VPPTSAPDVLIVTVGTTSGWRTSVRELTDSLTRAGASVELAAPGPLPRVRTFALTDFVEARAARTAARESMANHDPGAIIYCSMTAALLWPAPGAVWVDTIAAENRPGRHGVWQRPCERRRLAQAPLVLTFGERVLAPLPRIRPDAIVLPAPVEPSGSAPETRDIAAIAYAADPEKRRLEHILAVWARARRSDETLIVAGTAVDRLAAREGVRFAGRMAPAEYRALVRRARVFLAAPRREDYGIAPLEALADGCMLATTPSPGPYPALDLARELDPRLVDEDLVRAVRVALDDPLPGYAERASRLLGPFSRRAFDRTITEDVLPRLLATRSRG
jgi:hypothetical protein